MMLKMVLRVAAVVTFIVLVTVMIARAECSEDPPTYTYTHAAIEYRANGNVWLRVSPFYSCSAFADIDLGECGCAGHGENAFYCPSEIPQTVGLRGGDLLYVTLQVHGPSSGLSFTPGNAVQTAASPTTSALGSGYCQSHRWNFFLMEADESDELEKAFDEAFELTEERVVYLGKVNGVGWCFSAQEASCYSEYRLAPLTPPYAISFGGLYLEGNVAVLVQPEYKVLTGNPGGCTPECLELEGRKAGATTTWGQVKRLYD